MAGYDAQKIRVIPNFLTIPQSYQSGVGKYVAFCGRISREKGVDLILEVARRNPDIPFKLAGEIRDKELVKQIPDNCELVGYLSGDTLSQFYQDAAFFVMASRWYEGFPMSILEAACYGKPTIGPAHGGFTEIIGAGESAIGRLFKPNNIDDLERQVVSLWHAPDDITRLGHMAFDKLQREYSSEVVYKKWDSLFQELVYGRNQSETKR